VGRVDARRQKVVTLNAPLVNKLKDEKEGGKESRGKKVK